MKREDQCPACEGVGKKSLFSSRVDCDECGGTGERRVGVARRLLESIEFLLPGKHVRDAHGSPSSLLTGKYTGNAHAYRALGASTRLSFSSDDRGETLLSRNEYVEEWVQGDGASKFFVVRRERVTWWPWACGMSVTQSSEVAEVVEHPSLESAMASRPDWKKNP